jgi:O-antigen ligase
VDLDFSGSRGQLWKEHIIEGFFHPFGLGPSYVRVLREELTDRFALTRAFRIGGGAHNTWLQILLSAGIGGLTLFGLATYRVAKGLLVFIASDHTVFGLWAAGSFAGTLTSSFFIDSLELRWFWILLAFVIVVCENKKLVSTPEVVRDNNAQ